MPTASRLRTRRRVVVLFTATAAALAAARNTIADTVTYIGNTGTWSDPTVWDTGNVPTNNDVVNVFSSGASAAVLTYDATVPGANLSSLTVDYTGASGGSILLSQTTNTLSINVEYVGYNGAGTLSQSGGLNLTSFLSLGANAGSTGTFNLSSDAATLNVFGSIIVGDSGTGTFNQTGGTHTNYGLTIGANGAGAYFLSGANSVLTVNGAEIIGDSGSGSFTQSAGSHSASYLSIGNNVSGNGTFTISGGLAGFYDVGVGGSPYGGSSGAGVLVIKGTGTLSATNSLAVFPGGAVQLSGGVLTVGFFNYNNTAPINWTGGTLSVTSTNSFPLGPGTPLGNAPTIGSTQKLILGGSLIVPSGATLALNGGTITTNALDLTGAPNGFTWTTGALNLTSTNGIVFDVGTTFGNAFKLTTGQSLSVSGPVTVGATGNATFDQSGGQHSAASLDLGANSGAYGQYSLSNGATLTVANKAYIGDNGQGLLNQTGGTVNVNNGANAVYIGYRAGSSGTVNISGNSSVFNSSDVFVGNAGSGVFNQSSGLHALTGFLVLGGQADGGGSNSVGAYNLINGQLNANQLYAGLSGAGTFNQSAGHSVLGGLTAGYLPGSNGTVNLSGTADLFDPGQVILGDSGNGTLVQTGGSQLNAGLTLGNSAGGSGTVRLSGGTITVDGVTIVGGSGAGNFLQTGGTHAPSNLYLALSAGGSGTYTLNSGILHATSDTSGGFVFNGSEYVGYFGAATFNQTGGTHIVDSYFALARAFGSSATYNLSGGTLSAPTQSIGYQSTANNIFNQTGGANTATGYLTVGDQSGARGTYNLSGANSTLSVSFLFDAWQGIGGFNQSAGTATISSLYVAHEANSAGSYNLSGGTLLTTTSEDIGYQGNGAFNQTGGIHLVSPTATVTLSSASGGFGTYNLRGGTFTAGPVVNNGAMNLFGGTASFGALSGSGITTLTGTNVSTTTLAASRINQSSLSVGNNSTVTLAQAGALGQFTNTATSLAINGSGKLDLSNQRLLTNAPAATVRQYLVNGYNNGNWNGAGGISSTWAANDASHRTGLGYIAQTNGATLVAATLYGDTNLKGSVGLSDYNTLAANFNKSGTWAQGDFDYDGNVTLADYNKLATNFNKSAQPGGGVAVAPPAGAAAKAAAVTLTGSASPAATDTSQFVDPGVGKVALEADPTTGKLYIVGHDSNINSYEVDSASGKLTFVNQKNPGGYNTLTAQTFGAFLENSSNPGEDAWAVLSSAAGTYVAEVYPAGDNPDYDSIGPGLNVFDLNASGLSAWTAGTPISDLTFKYGDGTGATLTPAVIPIGVPEPTCLALAGIAAGALLGRKRRI